MADRHRPLFNVTISNVPGPPFPLYSIGARMVVNFPVGPIMDGGGLNMTVMSYLDQLDFGLQACPDVLPDVWSLAEGLQHALDELVEATGVHAGRGREAEPLSLTPSAARIDAATSVGVRVVAVLGARPEEPLEAVALVARHHVHVQVRHALAHRVVHRDERARRRPSRAAPRAASRCARSKNGPTSSTGRSVSVSWWPRGTSRT